MSKTFQPDSLHPYIMDARLKKATGSGGIGTIPIASADTVGGIKIGGSANPITITGSGNASVRKATSELLGVIKAGDGVSIDIDGAISGVAYSTTEHKTGRKWTDGSDIYERVVDVNVELAHINTIIADASYISDIISCVAIATTTHAYAPILCYMDNGALKGMTMSGFTASQIIIQYTKPTTP